MNELSDTTLQINPSSPPDSETPSPTRNTGHSRTQAALAGLGGGLIGGIVIAAIAGGLAVANWPELQSKLDLASSERVSTLENRISALEDKLAASGARTTTDAPAQPPAQAPTQPDPRLDAMTSRMDQLSREVDSLHSTMPDQNALVTLAARAEDALQNARNLADRRRSEEATLLSLGQLKEAIGRGDPFASELASVRRLAPSEDAPMVDSLSSFAPSGIPRTRDLASAFPPVAEAILAAATTHPAGTDLWGKIVDASMHLVSLRRIDGKGDDAAAIVSRAEDDLKQEDLGKAVHELSALPAPPVQAAAEWMKSAKARLDSERNLSALEADLVAREASPAQDRGRDQPAK